MKVFKGLGNLSSVETPRFHSSVTSGLDPRGTSRTTVLDGRQDLENLEVLGVLKTPRILTVEFLGAFKILNLEKNLDDHTECGISMPPVCDWWFLTS